MVPDSIDSVPRLKRILLVARLHQLSISRALTLIFITVSLFSVVVIFGASHVIKDRSLHVLASGEARSSAELVFLSLYSVMKRGWSKKDIEEVVGNIERTVPDTDVKLYRGDGVISLFGRVEGPHHPQVYSTAVQQVFASGNARMLEESGRLRFIYPVKNREICRRCHVNAEVGTINGVIEVSMLTDKLRAPLEFTISSLVYLFAIAGLLLGMMIYVAVRYFLVTPVRDLSSSIHVLSASHDARQRLPQIYHAFGEIRGLRDDFNILLGKLEITQRELRERSERDPLTGLYNRRKLEELALLEVKRSERHSHLFAVLLLDLNRFKPINDNYGHDAGDELLCEVSEVLSHALRGEDILARIGGDEFLVLAPETDEVGAEALATRLRQTIAEIYIERDGRKLSVGCSIGVALYPADGQCLDDIARTADERMFADKLMQGR